MGGGHTIPQSPDRASAPFGTDAGGATSVLKTLKKQITIGSTVDPGNSDVNPYGLAINGNTLYVCNFNNSANVQGTGTTIVTLSTTPGSTPAHFAGDTSLLGCSSLTSTPNEQGLHDTYATGALAPAVDQYCATSKCGGVGKLVKTIAGKNLKRPWGAVWAVSSGVYYYATKALFVSDATTGSIILAVSCQGGCTTPMTPIVTGFKVNHGKPGSVLGPSGLVFDEKDCVKIGTNPACGTLYVVDGASNTVVAIHNALNLRKTKSIVVGKSGKTFSGPEKSWASLVYSGSPLKGPISAALFANGNLVVGNTTEPAGTNSLIEIAKPKCTAVPCKPSAVLDKVNVDKGAGGALFGLAVGGSKKSPVLYFNDDNTNTVDALTP